jgi:hypothetical protein
MTAAMPSAGPSASRLRYLPVAVGASILHMLMMIPGYTEDGFEAGAWFSVLLFSLAVGVLVFAFVVPGAGAISGLVLGVLALLTVLVFWAGLTLPLAAAAALAGWRARQRGERVGMATAAVVLAAVAAVALVAIIIADAAAN